MAVFEDADGGVAQAVITSLARTFKSLVLLVLFVAPILFGAFVGHWATEDLDDPEGIAIERYLPPVQSGNANAPAFPAPPVSRING
ncbi:MAG: hypothetical protein O3B74_03860 [Proteobacteria bacterium]|nr:hypothetical protein [Pseudomonadota bacterium]MDA1310088.1 hypothetical protein [Pseudomonadota bacterium]